MLDGSVDLLEACVASIIRSVQGAPDGESLLDVSELARRGNPFPFIADRWPGLVITDPDEARYFQGSLHDPENPCLRLDDWQRDLLRCVFDEEYFSIVVKGNTKAGKGMVTALAINIWWDVYYRSKVVVTSSSADHAKANLFAEVVKWRRAMRPGSAGPGRVLTEALLDNDEHYVRVSNPLTSEGFSGQHGPRTLFAIDECSAIDADRVDDAEKQARKIVALGNPRSATGWLWHAFRLASPVDETQDVPTALGKRRCITVDGALCMNVKNKRLEKPQSPPGGIEIDGEYYPALSRIPPEAFAKVKPLIPDQCDYGRFVGIKQHPDSRHVAVFAHGKFPTEDPQKQVVLPSWLGRHVLAWNRTVPVTCFAFDAARSLDGDESVLAAGSSVGCAWLDGWKMADAIYHGERILEKALSAGVDLRKGRNPVCVDMDGGYGAGTADWLRRQNVWVIEYRGNDASDVDPRTYANRRAEGYGELGRRLSPDDVHKDEPWCLPADAQMHEDLAAGEKIYDKRDGLRFRLEPKDNIKIKLGRSPDRGDAVVMLYYAVSLFGKVAASSRTGASLVLWPPIEAVAEAELEQAADRRWWNS